MNQASPDPNLLSLDELFAQLVRSDHLRRLLALAVEEDVGPSGGNQGHSFHPPLAGDITTRAAIPDPRQAAAQLVPRHNCIVAGLACAPAVLEAFAVNLSLIAHARDGDAAAPGRPLLTLKGDLRHILLIERALLNLVSRLSGIATLTRQYVDAIGRAELPTGAARPRLFDTRKTIPGWRALEKYAVRCGGGYCHRLGLHDAMLIKDNHLAGIALDELAAFVREAISRGRTSAAAANTTLQFIEVEVDNLEQLERLLTLEPGSIDIILLDNFQLAELHQAVAMRNAANPKLKLEASGGITLDNIAAVAATGIDRIAIGALTHQARGVDIGLDISSL